MIRVLTHGTFDILHYGHIEYLRKAKALGDYLIVSLSTDEFAKSKGKSLINNYERRKQMLEAIRYVDLVIPQNSVEKRTDIEKYQADIFVNSEEYIDSEINKLDDICKVVFFKRTPDISSTLIKKRVAEK